MFVFIFALNFSALKYKLFITTTAYFYTHQNQWRTQKISKGGQSFVTIVWRHKLTVGEVPNARPF